ncbi:MAG TPA: hypothetical protein VG268_06160 [Streptosporangiaceae bacterium]|jgi:hypothetical protein|nr:hypothetical protein [Streptosporangiaceae bacterium]
MADNIKYYAVLGAGRSLANPSGLARRTFTSDGRLDESLCRDLTWKRSSEIYQWERGENLAPDLVEISADEAAGLVERFRQRWAE